MGSLTHATGEWKNKLKKEISDQFVNISNFYTELAEATNNKSKIFVLGYPQIVNGDPSANCRNILLLDDEEREMIVNSVIYLNNIIEQAAKKAGVTYLDVESSFGSHRICDSGNQHVNSIVGFAGWNGNQLQESFHPNAEGHEDIASTIWDITQGESLLTYRTCENANQFVCPDNSIEINDAIVPPYFKATDSEENASMIYYALTNGTLVKSVRTYNAQTKVYTYQPGTKVDLTLYSSPTRVGSFDVSSDGSVDASFAIPSGITAGFHTLIMSGVAPDGTKHELYQIVQVFGSNEQDIDEDGILDAKDKCLFIKELNIDSDDDGNDDACDPVINNDRFDKYILEYSKKLDQPTQDSAAQNAQLPRSAKKEESLWPMPAPGTGNVDNSDVILKSSAGEEKSTAKTNENILMRPAILLTLGVVVAIAFSSFVYVYKQNR